MNDPTPTLAFDAFWSWIVAHPNCILRAGTPEAVLYDDEDYHWHFAAEGTEALLVQVIRGKRLVGELVLAPEHVAYVVAAEDEGEFIFELISESETARVAAYFFVLSHGYDGEAETATSGRVH